MQPAALLGIGYRAPLHNWLGGRPADVQCLELTAEHFLRDPQRAARVTAGLPCSVHCLALSLGSAEAPDADYVRALVRLCAAVRPLWISDHLAFTRAGGIDLGHMNPLHYDEQTLAHVGDQCAALAQRIGVPVLLENISTHLLSGDATAEPAFLNALAQRNGVGVLLDVANLYINASNHGYDPRVWLGALAADNVRQLHIVGYGQDGTGLIDDHACAPQAEVLALLRQVIEHCSPQHVVLEWDRNLPASAQLQSTLHNLRGYLS